MRRQYHIRTSGDRRLIWDVHRLVELTKRLPVFDVALSTIQELDETFWFEGTPATCRSVALHARLISEADLRHPIILSSEGRVMDGMHRVCKALTEGRPTISAVKFEQDPTPDYIDADPDTLSYDER